MTFKTLLHVGNRSQFTAQTGNQSLSMPHTDSMSTSKQSRAIITKLKSLRLSKNIQTQLTVYGESGTGDASARMAIGSTGIDPCIVR